MQANEFEKKVQQAMDEFKLRPSDDVWQIVERRIRERKKKRRIIFFILFSFVGLALAGYGVYNFSEKQMTSRNENIPSEKINNSKTNTVKENTILTEKSIAGKRSGKKQTSGNSNRNGNGFVATNRKNSKGGKAASISQRATAIKIPPTNVIDNKSEKALNPATLKSIVGNENISANETQILKNELDQKNVTDSVKQDVSIIDLVDTGVMRNLKESLKVKATIAKKEKTKNQHSRKILWGINFSAGSSVISEDPFSFKGSNPLADLSSNSPNSYPAGGGVTRYPPSANKSVFAFKAGMVIKKEVSLRSGISVGLQYAYLGDRIKAGTVQTQTSAQSNYSGLFSYYRAIPQKAHTDRFHFIELPLIYSWRITRNDKHFISLNAGASFGYLLSTNALKYDTSFGGIYFHDKSLFAKTHVNAISGISYHFKAAKKFEFSIGPQFSFDLSRTIKSDLDKRKYFLYGGIDSRVFFAKKRKK